MKFCLSNLAMEMPPCCSHIKLSITLISAISFCLPGCAHNLMVREGEKELLNKDISSLKEVVFNTSLSSRNRLSFQQIRISVENNLIHNSTITEAYVRNMSSDEDLRISVNDFITLNFNFVDLQPGQMRKVHKGYIRRPSGKNYFDIVFRGLENEALPIEITVNFSQAMPVGTRFCAKSLWSDGP